MLLKGRLAGAEPCHVTVRDLWDTTLREVQREVQAWGLISEGVHSKTGEGVKRYSQPWDWDRSDNK